MSISAEKIRERVGKKKLAENFRENQREVSLAVSRRVVGNFYFCIIGVILWKLYHRVIIIGVSRHMYVTVLLDLCYDIYWVTRQKAQWY